ncbi:hypothetical protein GW796_10575 [archaeon]|nr:hypothetical protein [archaeon]
MAYPKSQDKKINKLSNVLIRYAEQEGVEFSFGGKPLYPVEALSFFGGLSLFLIEAKENYEKLYNNLYSVEELMGGLGKKIKEQTQEQQTKEQEFLSRLPKEKLFPIEFHEKEEDTFFGFIPRISETIPCDFLTIAHFSHYTLDEYLKIYKKNKMLLIDGRIPLDSLYDKMVTKINANKVLVVPLSSISKKITESKG